MMKFKQELQFRQKLLSAVFTAAGLMAIYNPAIADDVTEAPKDIPPKDIPNARDVVVVKGRIIYRDRSNETVPTLEYGSEYFQKFEPLTVGDALKRAPSITFLSDVIESDGARMRGLAPAYTKILVNGEEVTGGEEDRSFFVDRIPAELIKSVEIVRGSSARRSGDAMAGAINIVMRDAYALDGGFVRLGAMRFRGDELKGNGGFVWGGKALGGNILLGGSVQERYNPKYKQSWRYSEPPANSANFDNKETQSDTRDGTDYSFNANYKTEFEKGDFEFGGFYVKTERTESERSREYNVFSGESLNPIRATTAGNLLTDNEQLEKIDQNNYSLNSKLKLKLGNGDLKLKAGYAAFNSDVTSLEEEIDFDRSSPRFTGDKTVTNLDDKQIKGQAAYEFKLDKGSVEFGVSASNQKRNSEIKEQRNRYNLTSANRNGYNTLSNSPSDFSNRPYDALAYAEGGNYEINEDRLDVYGVYGAKYGKLKVEAGLRYETTNTDIKVVSEKGKSSADFNELLPSLSFKYELTDNDRITGSLAKTIRRPSFNMLSPALLIGEYGDNDYIGNPRLSAETALGGDIGFEHRIGNKGVIGINFFYRDVNDLLETYNTGAEGDAGADTWILSTRNSGDGKVYGAELDLSTPLTVFGLENTGVFLNYSWLDSEVKDELGTRRFNGQSNYIFNVGFIQDLPKFGASFGVTYRKQGDAFDRIVAEEVTTKYGADLEAFIEKRLADKLTIRFIASNLLNSHKEEFFNKFTTIDDQKSRSFDEYELEDENAGQVYQLVLRYAF